MAEAKPHHAEPAKSPAPAATPPVDKAFSHEELAALAGDLKPGEVGWVKLNEDGTPTGAATREPPSEGPFARVVGAAPVRADEVLTPTGAPVTKHMNPDNALWDEGMLARNPPPKPEPAKNTSPPPAPRK